MKKRNCAGPKSARLYLVKRERRRIQGRGPGSPALLILDQNEARRAENNFFWECPPPAFYRIRFIYFPYKFVACKQLND